MPCGKSRPLTGTRRARPPSRHAPHRGASPRKPPEGAGPPPPGAPLASPSSSPSPSALALRRCGAAAAAVAFPSRGTPSRTLPLSFPPRPVPFRAGRPPSKIGVRRRRAARSKPPATAPASAACAGGIVSDVNACRRRGRSAVRPSPVHHSVRN
jgi:hypothetical protein